MYLKQRDQCPLYIKIRNNYIKSETKRIETEEKYLD